ncbi:thioredoxin family protein [Streptomyces sp. MUM 203J]|uniref:thioredoxin family protein n=1 Tax=Streptomyces sp. MUM 203J TaxID=2791990 RepID=UPI001F03EE8A|nr:thioredoxin family protein [Streptomyces sp. MUM 203J]MCH0543383.1 thioredoxin family protein [Streptomyces sp. MUM 203J]
MDRDLCVLAVPDCPHLPLLLERLARVLPDGGVRDVSVRTVTSDAEAARYGMHGSPTLLVDGRDPFTPEGEASFGLSCRVFRRPDGRLEGAPGVDRLRAALGC